MNDTTANIILRLKDEFSKNLQAAGKNFESFAQSVDRVGSSIARTGMKMASVGTTLNAPFFAAAAAMSKYSFDAEQQMSRLSNEFLSLSKVVSDAALPTIQTFNDNFSRLVNYLKSIDPVMLQNIARWSMTAGAVLIAAGTFEIFLGKVISLIGKLGELLGGVISLAAAFPTVTLAIVAVAGALVLFETTWQKMAYGCQKNWLEFVIFFQETWKGLLELISKVPGANSFASQIDSLTISIQGMKGKLASLNVSGKSDLESFVNSSMTKLKQIQSNFNASSKVLATVSDDMKKRWESLSNSFSDGFGDAFSKVVVEGQNFADSMKNLFQGIAESIIKDFTSTAIKNVFESLLGVAQKSQGTSILGPLGAAFGSAFGPIGTAIGGFLGGALKFHEGGPIYAHAGLAPDEVPIIAQTGEGVLSRKGMRAIGGSNNLRKLNSGGSTGGQTIVINQVIQAWDSSDVYRNRKALSQAIADEIKNNGNMRSTINNYR